MADDSEQRICNKCKWFNGIASYCARGRRQIGVDPVYGQPVYSYKVLEYAHSQRRSILPWACGKNGRHFEPANP